MSDLLCNNVKVKESNKKFDPFSEYMQFVPIIWIFNWSLADFY